MAGSILSDKAFVPTDESLSAVLADGKALWDTVLNHVFSVYKKPGTEWKHYGKVSGWTLAVFSDKRRLVNLAPQNGAFSAVFSLSEKAAEKARSLGLPVPADTSCVCGYGFDYSVKTAADVEIVKKLLEIKDKN